MTKVKIGLSRTKVVPLEGGYSKEVREKVYVLGSIDYQPKHIEITGSKEDLDKV